jgi:hypothetical protein
MAIGTLLPRDVPCQDFFWDEKAYPAYPAYRVCRTRNSECNIIFVMTHIKALAFEIKCV